MQTARTTRSFVSTFESGTFAISLRICERCLARAFADVCVAVSYRDDLLCVCGLCMDARSQSADRPIATETVVPLLLLLLLADFNCKSRK